MEYLLVFRKNNFVGLYNMTNKVQLFNTTVDLLQDSLLREFGGDIPTNVTIVMDEQGKANPLKLPSLQEYIGY